MKLLRPSRLLSISVGVAVLGLGTAFAGPGARPLPGNEHRACGRAQLDRNERTVVAFYTTAFNQGSPAEAVEKYVGVDENGDKLYIQHNPQAADGPQAFVEFVSGFKASFPDLHVDIVRVIAECDLVVTHSHLTLSPDDRGSVGADIFRLDDKGKVVEHWDVIQQIPETSANDNGMF